MCKIEFLTPWIDIDGRVKCDRMELKSGDDLKVI